MKVKATTRGRIVIPSPIRRLLGITPSTRIHVEVDEVRRQIILTPITREYIRSLRGKFRGSGALRALEEERKREREREQ